jgi:hypothetical protein
MESTVAVARSTPGTYTLKAFGRILQKGSTGPVAVGTGIPSPSGPRTFGGPWCSKSLGSLANRRSKQSWGLVARGCAAFSPFLRCRGRKARKLRRWWQPLSQSKHRPPGSFWHEPPHLQFARTRPTQALAGESAADVCTGHSPAAPCNSEFLKETQQRGCRRSTPTLQRRLSIKHKSNNRKTTNTTHPGNQRP